MSPAAELPVTKGKSPITLIVPAPKLSPSIQFMLVYCPIWLRRWGDRKDPFLPHPVFLSRWGCLTWYSRNIAQINPANSLAIATATLRASLPRSVKARYLRRSR